MSEDKITNSTQIISVPLAENLFIQAIDYCSENHISLEEFVNNTIAEKLIEEQRREDNE